MTRSFAFGCRVPEKSAFSKSLPFFFGVSPPPARSVSYLHRLLGGRLRPSRRAFAGAACVGVRGRRRAISRSESLCLSCVCVTGSQTVGAERNVSLISLLLLEGQKRRALLCNLGLPVVAARPLMHLQPHTEAFKHLILRSLHYILNTFLSARSGCETAGEGVTSGLVKSIKTREFD